MTLPNEPLELAVTVYHDLQGRDRHGRNIQGIVPDGYCFDTLENKMDQFNLLVSSDKNRRSIEFTLPNQIRNFFALSFDELLQSIERRKKSPDSFYILDMGYLWNGLDLNPPQVIKGYFDAVKLFSALESASDHGHRVGINYRLVFLHEKKIEVDLSYEAEDLKELAGLSDFVKSFVDSEIHKNQKKVIIRTTLLEMFGDNQQASGVVSFGDVLSRFEEFNRKVKQAYELYVSEFSFDKIRGQVEKEKLEFVTKLNKVFSDIQNQLLAVPAALVLIGGQMKDTGAVDQKNLLIWLGCLVFAILMNLLIRNQRNTLNAVRQEIDQQWKQIKNEHEAVASRFEDVYKSLMKRDFHQRCLLWGVDFLVAFSLFVTTLLTLRYSVSGDQVIMAVETGIVYGVVGYSLFVVVSKTLIRKVYG